MVHNTLKHKSKKNAFGTVSWETVSYRETKIEQILGEHFILQNKGH